MKNIIFISIVLAFMSTACKKESEGISRVTNLAKLTLVGDRYVTLKVGQTFTDPGAKATEAGKDIEVIKTGEVKNQQGVYNITYSAINSDGYSASINRTVVVANIDPAAAAVDLSGDYARSTNGSVATWTKISDGVYTVFNPGGAPGTNLTVVAISPTTTSVVIPEQIASDGAVTSSAGSPPNNYNPATKTYTWKIINPGYGTGDRTFTKK